MRSVLQHCRAILRAAGSDLQNDTSLTVYVTNLDDWEEVDDAVADAFQTHPPSRTVLQVAAIRKGFRVQAALIARVDEQSGEQA
jgi:2-iminobutanoate/2-iminopropanoate deaminase